jgi:FkbM family methyltransferase
MAFGREEAFPSIYGALMYLRQWGFRPRYVADVGAYHGEWTRMTKEIYPTCSVLMVEPQEGKRVRLEEVRTAIPDVRFETALLGATEGETVDFVVMETGSSIFEEISDHHPRKKVEKRLTTLDALLARTTDWNEIDLLKLDVQGYELEILRGAPACLPRTEVVLMEVSIVPRNEGCPTIERVFEFMTARGFRMLDFCSQHRRANKALGQTDLLFLNARSSHAPQVFHDHARWMESHNLDPAADMLSPAAWKP